MRRRTLRAAPSTAIALLLLALSTGCGPRLPEHQPVGLEAGAVRIARADVADGEVHFFTFDEGEPAVPFLVRTDSTGALQVHLDACFSCYRYKMGFVIEGEDLVCRACRYRYRIADPTWDLIGACAPISIPARVEGGELLIEQKVLQKARRYF